LRKLTSIVSVNTSHDTTICNMDVGESRSTLVLRIAVSAGSVNLAKGVGEEVLDGNSSTTVVLQDLVRSTLGTTTVDVGCSGGLLEGSSVLTDIKPPDVVQGTCTETVNTLAVVGADDDVGENGTGLENENCIGIASFGLVVAGGDLGMLE
jgi:hypothetical protein